MFPTILAGVIAACTTSAKPAPPAGLTGIHKIQHVVMIMQENRSFDSYFGTYPGADGIPMSGGAPTVCNPDPATSTCIKPYHDASDRNSGGPHGMVNARADVHAGAMDGFVAQQATALKACADTNNPTCSQVGNQDVMGYHDAREIPNYWTYAQQFVLQDHMFEPDASWSLPSHLFLVSGWSARCSQRGDPMSCRNAPDGPQAPPDFLPTNVTAGQQVPRPDYAWTDLTYLLHRQHVTWRYYVAEGTEPDCEDDSAITCPAVPQKVGTPGIWNVLPWFDTVTQDGERGNIQTANHLVDAARTGTLPNVAWVVPNGKNSEHPPALVSAGQAWVTSLVDVLMTSPEWSSTAIFIAWDDWGGFYDHVVPPAVDQNGYGLRVPGLLISPYARRGFIDHQTLSFDAYAKFIEDDFLNGQRLDPATDGRPDPRPTVRETVPILGDLGAEFDFSQPARPPMVLPLHPAPGPASS